MCEVEVTRDAARSVAIVLSTVKKRMQDTRKLLDDPEFVTRASASNRLFLGAAAAHQLLTVEQELERQLCQLIMVQKTAAVRKLLQDINIVFESSADVAKMEYQLSTSRQQAARRTQLAVDTLAYMFGKASASYAAWHGATNRCVLNTVDAILDDLYELSGRMAP